MRIKNFMFPGLLILVFFTLGTVRILPCTVAVISGKVTPDGRPLMWKNRDTSSLDNKIGYFKGIKYDFIGLIDTRDDKGENVWAGINSEGFAIMNSASGDLAQGLQQMSENGRLMRLALEECATVPDFEDLLEKTKGKRKVGANFGVIDAEGNACFFEISNTGFEKFCADDARVAPYGYIIRTNYAFTAPVKNKGGGYIRFERASRLFQAARSQGHLNLEFIIQQASRDLVNEKLHSYPLSDPRVYESSAPLYINTNDTINRNSTVSVAVFHGVTSREKAYLSTMWILLGQPICSVAVPLWASAAGVPSLVSGEGNAPLNDFSRALASFLYPDKRGHMRQYLNVSGLKNYSGEGVLAKLLKIENQVFSKTETKLKEWEKQKPNAKDMFDFEEKITNWIFKALKSSFPNIK